MKICILFYYCYLAIVYIYTQLAMSLTKKLIKMAYITTEEVAQIRADIKAAFPKDFKFSITKQHYSVVTVALMESPLSFDKTTFYQHPKGHKAIIKIIKAIVNKKNFNHSDSMTDYFHVGFYSHINLGKYDKPYQQKQAA